MTLRLTTSSNQTSNVNSGDNTNNIASSNVNNGDNTNNIAVSYQQLFLLLQNNFDWIVEKTFWIAIGMIPVVGPAIKTIKSIKERDFYGAFINAGFCFADILSWGYDTKYEILIQIIRYSCYTLTTMIELKRYLLPYFTRQAPESKTSGSTRVSLTCGTGHTNQGISSFNLEGSDDSNVNQLTTSVRKGATPVDVNRLG